MFPEVTSKFGVNHLLVHCHHVLRIWPCPRASAQLALRRDWKQLDAFGGSAAVRGERLQLGLTNGWGFPELTPSFSHLNLRDLGQRR